MSNPMFWERWCYQNCTTEFTLGSGSLSPFGPRGRSALRVPCEFIHISFFPPDIWTIFYSARPPLEPRRFRV